MLHPHRTELQARYRPEPFSMGQNKEPGGHAWSELFDCCDDSGPEHFRFAEESQEQEASIRRRNTANRIDFMNNLYERN